MLNFNVNFFYLFNVHPMDLWINMAEVKRHVKSTKQKIR